MARIIHKELSYIVNGCIFDVHNEVGPGLREECYQKAMEQRLGQEGLTFLAKPATRREMVHRSDVVDVFEPDLIVADQIILELKAQREGVSAENFVQLLTYLKFWKVRLGFLVNFGQSQALIERVPYTPSEAILEENYDFIKELVTSELRPTLRGVRDSLLAVHGEFGSGYCDTTYRKLVEVELRNRGLECRSDASVTPTFRECSLPTSRINPLVVNKTVLVEIQALHDEISATAVRSLQTHLRLSGGRVGLIASFGKNRFVVCGVHP